LLIQLKPISYLAGVAADPTSSIAVLRTTGRLLVHAVGGLVALLVVQVLGVYKPGGMTQYGWRKQNAGRTQSQP
jgi:hypothetical protein